MAREVAQGRRQATTTACGRPLVQCFASESVADTRLKVKGSSGEQQLSVTSDNVPDFFPAAIWVLMGWDMLDILRYATEISFALAQNISKTSFYDFMLPSPFHFLIQNCIN